MNEEPKDLSPADLISALLTSDGKGKEYKLRCLHILLSKEYKAGYERGIDLATEACINET